MLFTLTCNVLIVIFSKTPSRTFLFFFAVLGLPITVHRLSCPHSMRDPRSRPGIEPTSPCIARQILNHWTTQEVPYSYCFKWSLLCSLWKLSEAHNPGCAGQAWPPALWGGKPCRSCSLMSVLEVRLPWPISSYDREIQEQGVGKKWAHPVPWDCQSLDGTDTDPIYSKKWIIRKC